MPLAEAFVRSGKVRDLYRLDEERLLLVASDRLSAFDVVLPTPIPDKGRVLTGLSRFWFHETAHLVPNHLLSVDPADVPIGLTGGNPAAMDELRGRLMIGRTAEVLPIECVVRGYLSGSGWKEYGASGSVCGIPLPDGLRESDRLPEPVFTPGLEGAPGRSTTRTSPSSGSSSSSAIAHAEALRQLSHPPVRAAGSRSARRRGSSSPTRSSSSACCPTAS